MYPGHIHGVCCLELTDNQQCAQAPHCVPFNQNSSSRYQDTDIAGILELEARVKVASKEVRGKVLLFAWNSLRNSKYHELSICCVVCVAAYLKT